MRLFDVFKRNKETQSEKSVFQCFGYGFPFKSDEELKSINTEEADSAFKKCKKDILDPYMKQNGFIKYKTKAYVRLNQIGLIEYVDLQKEAHGSRTVTLNIAMLPLYVPHEYITIGFGHRIGTLIRNKDFWWDFRSFTIAEKSFNNIVSALEEFVMPWFTKYSDEDSFRDSLLYKKHNIGYSFITWVTYIFIRNNDFNGAMEFLNSIDSFEFYQIASDDRRRIMDEKVKEIKKSLCDIEDFEQYIREVKLQNIEKFKFPVKWKI